jgi:hypothetical protein
MYLVTPDYLGTTIADSQTQKPPAEKKKRHSKKPKHSVHNNKKKKTTKKDTVTRAYDKWVKVRARLREADVQRERQIHTIAAFLKKVLPYSTFDLNVKPKFDVLLSGTQTGLLPPPPPPPTAVKRHILSDTPKRAPPEP